MGLSLPLPGNVIEEGTKSVVLPESKEGSFKPVSRASAPSLGPVPSDPGLREETTAHFPPDHRDTNACALSRFSLVRLFATL